MPPNPLTDPTTHLTIRILLLPLALATLALTITWATDNHEKVYVDTSTDYPITAYVFLTLSLLTNLHQITQHLSSCFPHSSNPHTSPQNKWRKLNTYRLHYGWILFLDLLLFSALLCDGAVELYIIYGWVNSMGKAMGVLCWVVGIGHLLLALLTTITCCQTRAAKKALKRGSIRLRDEENTTTYTNTAAENTKEREEVIIKSSEEVKV